MLLLSEGNQRKESSTFVVFYWLGFSTKSKNRGEEKNMNQQNQSAINFIKTWSIREHETMALVRVKNFRNIKTEEFQKAYVKVVYGRKERKIVVSITMDFRNTIRTIVCTQGIHRVKQG